MAIREKDSKPKEILELEEIYNINIVLRSETNKYHSCVYNINDNGQLIELNIIGNTIDNITPLSKFVNLEILILPSNLIKDISPLSHLLNLRALNLSHNKITDIEPISKLIHLEELDVYYNPIEKFKPIEKLIKLKILSCSDTKLNDLSFISKLSNLETLEIAGNNLHELNDFSSLEKLKHLNAANNSIMDISCMEDLPQLQNLWVQHNLIRKIPQTLAKKRNWLENSLIEFHYYSIGIYLYGNPLEYPPVSVIELGKETVKSYYEASEQLGHEALSEGRIIVVGDGASGKSSLIEKILYGSFEQGRAQTNGIRIEHFQLNHPEDNRLLTFHTWDFGGQEIQHAVHKFFFTEGCLYILVLDNRKEEEPEYWLQQIESLGGKAPVMVVFNKHDENPVERADRKFLKEKYPNIIGFYDTSCLTGFGIDDFKRRLYEEAIKLRTVNEQFPNNWLAIKKAIGERTSGSEHYLTYDVYKEICLNNHVHLPKAQTLLLKYFNTIGAVTWFGEDTHLRFLHVLKPEWITQGVYRILTSPKTARLFGQIDVSDFNELLQPLNKDDYTYEEHHYGFILTMMKKFDLCYTEDDKHLLIPSAFGKTPKVEYTDYKGHDIRTYILQFKEYMPLALIHRFIARNLSIVFERNYWHTGIVIKDTKSSTQAMVHADKEAKRIYIRIKGDSPIGIWESVRRDLETISNSYAKIPYDELVLLDEPSESTVNYDHLVSYLEAGKPQYFHPKLKTDYNVGYLLGMFQTKEMTLEKIKKEEITAFKREGEKAKKIPQHIINILNNNTPHISNTVNTSIVIDIDLQIVNQVSSKVKGEAAYLLDELNESNEELVEALKKIVEFANDAKSAKNSGEVIEKGWGRKLKKLLTSLGDTGDSLKKIEDGGETIKSMYNGIKDLAAQFNISGIKDVIDNMLKSIS